MRRGGAAGAAALGDWLRLGGLHLHPYSHTNHVPQASPHCLLRIAFHYGSRISCRQVLFFLLGSTMAIDPDDEFYGDQSSDTSDANENTGNHDVPSSSEAYGNASSHEYRSQAASIRTLSYLDGYDETKEEKLQDGFAHGYKKSFHDAFEIGRRLGSLCAKAAFEESTTLNDTTDAKDDAAIAKIERHASSTRQFLTERILVGNKKEDDEKKYDEALLKLKDQLDEARI